MPGSHLIKFAIISILVHLWAFSCCRPAYHWFLFYWTQGPRDRGRGGREEAKHLPSGGISLPPHLCLIPRIFRPSYSSESYWKEVRYVRFHFMGKQWQSRLLIRSWFCITNVDSACTLCHLFIFLISHSLNKQLPLIHSKMTIVYQFKSRIYKGKMDGDSYYTM